MIGLRVVEMASVILTFAKNRTTRIGDWVCSCKQARDLPRVVVEDKHNLPPQETRGASDEDAPPPPLTCLFHETMVAYRMPMLLVTCLLHSWSTLA